MADRALDLKHQPGFPTVAACCLTLLYAPIAVLVAFSFNASRSVTNWGGFSLDWYVQALANEGIKSAAMISLEIATTATVVSTVIATAAALATTRTRRFRGQGLAYGVIHLPLMVPEIVTAIATLSFFALIRVTTGIGFGLGNLIIAHTVFCIPFAYLPIRARLEDMDLTLEQAAADLYANPWQTFRRVTLPLLVPGIVAGAMLAFIVSLDDVIISAMVAGPGETTLPIYVLGQIRRGVTPEVNAVSTLLLVVSVLFVTLFFLLGRKRKA
jgi:spermidine/putrescine transport system permease protein